MSNSEETLEMAIRLFDYIYFKDLSTTITKEGEYHSDNHKRSSDDAVDSYDCNNKRLKTDDDNKETNLLVGFKCKQKEESVKCSCGSYHNGWLKLNQLQLIALTCYFLSCKFWERFPPKVNHV
jgi:hypothetical protein